MRLVEQISQPSNNQSENRMWSVSAGFPVTLGLHQGSAMSPLLIVVLLDVLSESVRKEELCELLYADDLGILADTGEELQRSVVEWH